MNEGKLTIEKNSSNDETYGSIRIQLKDKDLHCVAEVYISFENFAKAITGIGFQPCRFEIAGNVKEERDERS